MGKLYPEGMIVRNWNFGGISVETLTGIKFITWILVIFVKIPKQVDFYFSLPTF
jgi:hypothetical protein